MQEDSTSNVEMVSGQVTFIPDSLGTYSMSLY
jgi:hypothetical protein